MPSVDELDFLRSLAPTPEDSELRRLAEENMIPIITPEVENFLGLILTLTKPKKILEIGTAVGYSALFMQRTCGTRVVTIEKNPEMAALAQTNENISLMVGDALEILPNLIENAEQFDFVFLDAAKSQYLRMLPDVLRLLPRGGVLVADNVLFKGKIADAHSHIPHKHRTATRNLRAFLEEISRHPLLKTSVIPLGDGISISLKQ